MGMGDAMSVDVERRPGGTYRVRVRRKDPDGKWRVERELGAITSKAEATKIANRLRRGTFDAALGHFVGGEVNITNARATHVYLLEAAGAGRFKIGSSSQVKRRVAALMTASALTLTVVATWEIRNARKAEHELHRRLRAHRLHGEWFTFSSADEAKAAVEHALEEMRAS